MRPYLLSFALSAFALPASSQQSWSGSLSLDRSEALGDEFGGGGSLGVSASVYRWLGARIALGLELGHTRFGSNTSVVPDAVGPGTVLTEEYGWSAWHATAVARIRLAEAGVRPFVISGIGAYWTRTRDRIEARDGSGARIPLYDFSQGRTELNPGASSDWASNSLRCSGGFGLAAMCGGTGSSPSPQTVSVSQISSRLV